ncbi:MAG: alpha-1,2-fucosyltransferase [Sphingobacterium sp.]|uniref:alpha-1,2-fucosyltransferase n=1 Tax=Sphingobacterium sp. JB170 TaxID=1434842 RepID=UPI00097EDDBB|nr:alpha-1,2-fucosyltransferase [Sphingobacterium sp. JB170]SJN25349.1 Alpha-1,2-fucosyltransferase [Sphingobacterium sp. JB170]
MKIVKFLGGLGNQLFQYAFYLGLEENFTTVKSDLTDFRTYKLHNGFELEKIFGVKLRKAHNFEIKLHDTTDRRWIWRKLRRIAGTKNAYHQESKPFAYDASIFKNKKNKYYWGYWQHIDYINLIEEKLRARLTFPKFTDTQNLKLIERMKQHETVAIHVRRGDYLSEPLFKNICDKAYYKRSINYINEHVESPLYLFFSDDIEWCRKTFSTLQAFYVDWNKGEDSFRDMQLISLCNHVIISNSTFSWWGAWLNDREKKIVVAPQKWKNDPFVNSDALLLKSFIRL